MTATAKTQLLIPPPEPNLPDCPLCWKETTHDGDTLVCRPCGVGWPDDWSRPGFRLDDDAPQCAAEIAPYAHAEALAHVRYRCVYNDGHPDLPHAGGRVDGKGGPGGSTYAWSGPTPQRLR